MKTRTTKPLTVSLPPQLVQKTDAVVKETGKTRSEVFRDALWRYFDELEFRALARYGERQVRKAGVRLADVERLVGEVRRGHR